MAGRKTAKQKQTERETAQWAQWVSDGFVYAVAWSVDSRKFGPLPMKTLDEAVVKRDEMMNKHSKPIPDDYYGRQAYLEKFKVHVLRYDRGQWSYVDGSMREGVWGVKYAD